MKRTAFIPVLCLLLSSCFRWSDEVHEETRITADIWLRWWGEQRDQHLLQAFDDNPDGGSYLVAPVVFAVGTNGSYIIAKQHPDLESTIHKRLFKPAANGDYELENPADTIYISQEDSIYTHNGKWYHTSNGWNPPDSLKPYRAITYYHIIDIRHYNTSGKIYHKYTYMNEEDFIKARKLLGVPDNLDFTITTPELE